jgi:hypothetical protein
MILSRYRFWVSVTERDQALPTLPSILNNQNKHEYNMARNFYWSTFFGHIFNRNNLTFIKARILRKEYFNRSRLCFLDFTITSNLEKYF